MPINLRLLAKRLLAECPPEMLFCHCFQHQDADEGDGGDGMGPSQQRPERHAQPGANLIKLFTTVIAIS